MTAHEGQVLRVQMTVAHSRLILQALAELPFKSVFEVIGQLNQQTHRLLADEANDSTRMHVFFISPSDLAICIHALGEMPFKRVSTLLTHLNCEILAQRHLAPNLAMKEETPHGAL